MTTPTSKHAGLMDDIYKSQRHIYDVTRKYYLLGRDRLIDDLKPEPGQKVLEVGCGTGRNLVKAAKTYPEAEFYGFDISSEMLISAQNSVNKAELTSRVHLAQGDASNFSTEKPFDISAFDRVFYSYTLSMIPPWEKAVHEGINVLSDDGRLHIVDFGEQENLPGLFRHLLKKWLALFHVESRKGLFPLVEKLDADPHLKITKQMVYADYARIITISKIT